jgi:hypothetical protein
MPRGRPKGSKNKVKTVSMNLNLPAGGTRFLKTKKRIAAATAAYAAMSPIMLSGANSAASRNPYGTPKRGRGRPRSAAAVSSFNAATPTQRAAMISSLTNTANYKRKFGPKRPATAAQLASLAKARAARAGSSGGSGGSGAVAVGDAAGRGLIGGIMSALGNFV